MARNNRLWLGVSALGLAGSVAATVASCSSFQKTTEVLHADPKFQESVRYKDLAYEMRSAESALDYIPGSWSLDADGDMDYDPASYPNTERCQRILRESVNKPEFAPYADVFSFLSDMPEDTGLSEMNGVDVDDSTFSKQRGMLLGIGQSLDEKGAACYEQIPMVIRQEQAAACWKLGAAVGLTLASGLATLFFGLRKKEDDWVTGYHAHRSRFR
ncbi:MAG: hypothetical protein Q7R96_02545 [Nanoarchaeota archaeon]|nr:hypothetical protein [Nanoarchaeota archaeon]